MDKKRVLIVTQYFYPESFRINDVGQELVKRGHCVDALVGIPNYPEGKYFKGYGLFKKRSEIVNGVHIYRVLQTPRGKKPSLLQLSINYVSYAFFAFFWVLTFAIFKKKYDAILVFQTSPVTQAFPAIFYGKLRRVPVYTWVQDIWPDSVVSTTGDKDGKLFDLFKRILSSMTDFVYRNSFRIMVSSKGMEPLVCRNADYSGKIIYVPNWCDDMMSMPLVETTKLPGVFKIMMAGNLADGIGVDTVINLVETLSDIDDIMFIFVGGGALADYMKEQFDVKKLKNVVMTGRLPFSYMPELYNQADAMLLTLKFSKLPHLKATVPSRLQSYMSAGKPILGMIDGCANDVIREAQCGYCAAAGDVESLSSFIRKEVLPNKEQFRSKGKNSRLYFERYYQKEGCISNLEFYLSGKTNNPPYSVPIV